MLESDYDAAESRPGRALLLRVPAGRRDAPPRDRFADATEQASAASR